MTETRQSGALSSDFRLDLGSGVPVYRQIIDQVTGGIAAGRLRAGAQLPTVRQMAVDLAVNPNTVMRAYRELEIRGILDTQQGTGTFISRQPVAVDEVERERRLDQIVGEFAARAGAEGFSVRDLLSRLRELDSDKGRKGRSGS
ncbi:MAG: GntR family transcriptional regulator [Bryobacteraceae bacterium]|nr:GntR family transcriptional regulator [Bryobacteraceae bacterium]